jgi:hypothetical protein
MAAAVAAVAAAEVMFDGAGSFLSTNRVSAPSGVVFGQAAAPAVAEGLAFLGFGILVVSLAGSRRGRNRG